MIYFMILLFDYFSNLFFIGSVIRPVHSMDGVTHAVTVNGFSTQVRVAGGSRVNRLYSAVGCVTSRLDRTRGLGGSFVSSMSRRLHAPLATVEN